MDIHSRMSLNSSQLLGRCPIAVEAVAWGTSSAELASTLGTHGVARVTTLVMSVPHLLHHE